MAEPARTSPEDPWPVRLVSKKIFDWIGRLGWVWIDGRIDLETLKEEHRDEYEKLKAAGKLPGNEP